MQQQDRIVHHEDWQGVPLWEFMLGVWAAQRRRGWPRKPDEQAPGNITTEARINHGRWLAECPQGDGGALVVSQEAPIFMCPSCWNAEHGGRWIRVKFPAPKEKAQIEAALLQRPRTGRGAEGIAHRNWEPGESVAALRRENRAHGIGV